MKFNCIHALHGRLVFLRQRGGGAGGLAEHHPGGLDAEGVEGHAGTTEGTGDEEVLTLGGLRREGAVGDLINGRDDEKTAFIDDLLAIRRGEAAHDMRVHREATERDGVRLGEVVKEVALRDDEVADHAAAFAGVEVVGPVGVVGELILWQAPLLDVLPDGFGQGGIGAQEPEQAVGVAAMRFPNESLIGICFLNATRFNT